MSKVRCACPIYAFGTEARRTFSSEWPAVNSSGALDYRANAVAIQAHQTRAKVDGGYILNGAKMWITNGPIAGVAIVWAKVEDGDAKSIKGFLVEREFEGFHTPKMTDKMSLRASWTGEIVLEDCFVPDENMLPNVSGLKGPELPHSSEIRDFLGCTRPPCVVSKRSSLLPRPSSIWQTHRRVSADTAEVSGYGRSYRERPLTFNISRTAGCW